MSPVMGCWDYLYLMLTYYFIFLELNIYKYVSNVVIIGKTESIYITVGSLCVIQ